MNKIIFENIKNSKVLLRCDFNEPIDKNQSLLSVKRIDANLETLQELLTRNNKIILISHHSDKNQKLLPVYNYLKKSLPQNTKTDLVYLDEASEEIVKEYFLQNKNDLPEIILLENTRLFTSVSGEFLDEKNDENFAKFLASLADYFVYDAFSVGHRDHSSTTGVAKILPTCFGKTFQKEHSSLSKVLNNTNETMVIMGGAKLSTKLPIIEKFLNGGATVCVGGAMVHPILQAENIDIKNSYLEKGYNMPESEMVKLLEYIKSGKLILPEHFSWALSEEGSEKIVDSVFDSEKLEDLVSKNNIKNILWNGPVGMYEEGDVEGSAEIYKFIKSLGKSGGSLPSGELGSSAAAKNTFTILGGGDTLTMLEGLDFDFEENFSYISLSGGAMLTFLSEGTLPILDILENKK